MTAWQNPLPAKTSIEQEIVFQSLTKWLASNAVTSLGGEGLVVQAGSASGTTDALGGMLVTFPTPFPNSLIAVVPVMFTANPLLPVIELPLDPAEFNLKVFQGTTAYALQAVEVFYIAVGT